MVGTSRTFGRSREHASGWAPGTYRGAYRDGGPLARVIFPHWSRVVWPSPGKVGTGGCVHSRVRTRAKASLKIGMVLVYQAIRWSGAAPLVLGSWASNMIDTPRG
jgi:hypothetical protein